MIAGRDVFYFVLAQRIREKKVEKSFLQNEGRCRDGLKHQKGKNKRSFQTIAFPFLFGALTHPYNPLHLRNDFSNYFFYGPL